MLAPSSLIQPESADVRRRLWLRLWPESQSVAYQLAGTAGACRFVWHHCLERQQQEYAAYKVGKREQAPNVFCFGMGPECMAMRQDPPLRLVTGLEMP